MWTAIGAVGEFSCELFSCVVGVCYAPWGSALVAIPIRTFSKHATQAAMAIMMRFRCFRDGSVAASIDCDGYGIVNSSAGTKFRYFTTSLQLLSRDCVL